MGLRPRPFCRLTARQEGKASRPKTTTDAVMLLVHEFCETKRLLYTARLSGSLVANLAGVNKAQKVENDD
jgi:hypothetical protein